MPEQIVITHSNPKKPSRRPRAGRDALWLGLWAVGAVINLADVFVFASRHEPANALFSGIAAVSFGALLGLGVRRKTT